MFKSRAFNFARLLGNIAFGHDDQAVAGGEFGERLGNPGADLDRMLGDGVREAMNSLVQRRRERLDGELLEGLDQGMRKAMQSVTQLAYAVALHIVQHLTNLPGGEFVVIQEGDEVRDRSLEVDVVLPQRIVGVDEQDLGRE